MPQTPLRSELISLKETTAFRPMGPLLPEPESPQGSTPVMSGIVTLGDEASHLTVSGTHRCRGVDLGKGTLKPHACCPTLVGHCFLLRWMELRTVNRELFERLICEVPNVPQGAP